MTYNYTDLKEEFSIFSDGSDAWGSTLSWWSTIAGELYHNRNAYIPDAWCYRASPCGNDNDPDSIVTEIVENATTEALLKFGNVLTRYARRLKRAGKDY